MRASGTTPLRTLPSRLMRRWRSLSAGASLGVTIPVIWAHFVASGSISPTWALAGLGVLIFLGGVVPVVVDALLKAKLISLAEALLPHEGQEAATSGNVKVVTLQIGEQSELSWEASTPRSQETAEPGVRRWWRLRSNHAS